MKKIKVFDEQGNYLGLVKSIDDKHVTIEQKLTPSQGMIFSVKKERVKFESKTAIVKERT